MKKGTITRCLNFLKDVGSDDKELVVAAELLLSKVSALNLSSESDELVVSGSLPLPTKQMTFVDNSYALFSDGACRGNPGPGSWGMVGQDSSGTTIFKASGVDTLTTNNKMELEGAIQALVSLEEFLEENNFSISTSKVGVFSDSKYVVDGISKWVEGWKRRGWKKADKKPPENVEQWKQLDALNEKFPKIKFFWVKGHSGHPQNELCDQLANQALDEAGF